MTEPSKKNYSRMEILHQGVMVKRECPRCKWPLYLMDMETWACPNCGLIQTLEEFSKDLVEKIKNKSKRERFLRGLFLFCVCMLFTSVPLGILLVRVIPSIWKTIIIVYIVGVWLAGFVYSVYTDWKKKQEG